MSRRRPKAVRSEGKGAGRHARPIRPKGLLEIMKVLAEGLITARPSNSDGIRGVITCQRDKPSAFRAAKPLDSAPAPGHNRP